MATAMTQLFAENYAEWRKAHPRIAGGETMTIEDIEARQAEIVARRQELDAEFQGRGFTDEVRAEWDELGEEHDANKVLLAELHARHDTIVEDAQNSDNTEPPRGGVGSPQRARIVQRAGRSMRDVDVWNLAEVRALNLSPAEETRELRDRALAGVERSVIPHPGADRNKAEAYIERLLSGADLEAMGGVPGGAIVSRSQEIARQILMTGSQSYRRGFWKAMHNVPRTPDEERALSLTGASGGFAVPFALDPTIIPVSNLSVNPYRAVANVKVIGGSNTWQGVTMGAIAATYATEAAEAGDNAPTLAQPQMTVQRCHVFVPYTFEIGQDWGQLEEEMAIGIADAKDDVEASQFSTGVGTTVFPQGIQVGITTTVNAGPAQALTPANVYSVYGALPARFKPRATWMANEVIWNLIRQFDTAGGAQQLLENLQLGTGGTGVPTPGNLPFRVLGRAASECSGLASVTTTGTKFLYVGDFRYYVIVERVGMMLSNVPHLFGAAFRPTGQSGLYGFWRNTAKVVDTAAFRVLLGAV